MEADGDDDDEDMDADDYYESGTGNGAGSPRCQTPGGAAPLATPGGSLEEVPVPQPRPEVSPRPEASVVAAVRGDHGLEVQSAFHPLSALPPSQLPPQQLPEGMGVKVEGALCKVERGAGGVAGTPSQVAGVTAAAAPAAPLQVSQRDM
jgi:hypothetical protein